MLVNSFLQVQGCAAHVPAITAVKRSHIYNHTLMNGRHSIFVDGWKNFPGCEKDSWFNCPGIMLNRRFNFVLKQNFVYPTAVNTVTGRKRSYVSFSAIGYKGGFSNSFFSAILLFHFVSNQKVCVPQTPKKLPITAIFVLSQTAV